MLVTLQLQDVYLSNLNLVRLKQFFLSLLRTLYVTNDICRAHLAREAQNSWKNILRGRTDNMYNV